MEQRGGAGGLSFDVNHPSRMSIVDLISFFFETPAPCLLPVPAMSTVPFTAQWFFNGAAISGQRSAAELEVKNVNDAVAGEYHCVFTSVRGVTQTTRCAVAVSAGDVPTFEVHGDLPATIAVPIGDVLRLSVFGTRHCGTRLLFHRAVVMF